MAGFHTEESEEPALTDNAITMLPHRLESFSNEVLELLPGSTI
jgi:hypothetical protein